MTNAPTVDSHKITIPQQAPQWKWCLNGNWDITFFQVTAPNRFHRFMQRLILGIYWVKL